MEQQYVHSQYHKWLTKLMGFSFDICYKEGKLNTVVDALSRAPHLVDLASISISAPLLLDVEAIQQEIFTNLKVKILKSELIKDPAVHPHFSLHHGVLLYKNKLVLPSSIRLIPQLLKDTYESPIGGHEGFLRTYKKLSRGVY